MHLQEQPPEVFCEKRCEKFRKFPGKAPVFESLFLRLQHRCFPVNIVKFLRTPTLNNIYKRRAYLPWRKLKRVSNTGVFV